MTKRGAGVAAISKDTIAKPFLKSFTFDLPVFDRKTPDSRDR